jgi:heme-degrading monooxygenase HmoA
MLYSVRLYLVAPGNASAFTAALRDGGLWRELARQQLPGLIGVDLLRCHSRRFGYLSIEFWVSEAHLLQIGHAECL